MSETRQGGRTEVARYVWERSVRRSLRRRRTGAGGADLERLRAWSRSSTRPRLSVCIPTQGRTDLLVPCLASLQAQRAHADVELVIGYTGPDSAGRKLCDELGLARVDVAGPFNFSRVCNEMAAAARGPRLLFLNDDTTAMSQAWDERLMDGADDEVTGAALVYPGTDRLQHLGIEVVRRPLWPARDLYGPPIWVRPLHGLALRSVGIGRNLGEVTMGAHEVMAVAGAFLALSRSAFERLGGFDEQFGVDLQDIDLCLRARQLGSVVRCRTDIVFSHQHAASRGRYRFPREDWRLLCSRWEETLARWVRRAEAQATSSCS